MIPEGAAALAAELDKLQRVQADLASIATRTDDRRRHDLIALRRLLSDQIATVGIMADPFFSVLGDETLRTYRAKFSHMRSAAALHQADWPAVRLGESVDAYRASALGVREANREFVAWAKVIIAALTG